MYNWATRRRLFLLLRWFHLPIPVANWVDRLVGAARRRLRPIWDPIDNAEERSESLYARLGNRMPDQLAHTVTPSESRTA
jgi:hypothetical protein